MKKNLEQIIWKVAETTKMDPNLIKAIIQTESAGKINAESPYARGLMQVSEMALNEINKRYNLNLKYSDLFDPEANILVGTLYFRDLLTYFARRYEKVALPLAAASYNWGIGNVINWLKNTPPDNSKIDESIPEETKAHFYDIMWWYVHFLRSDHNEK